MLALSAKAIHSEDPNAQIVTGGVISTPQNPKAIPGNKFLKKMFRSKAARRAADVVAIHPYTGYVKDVKRQIGLTREMLDKVKVDAPIWITEIGWGTGTTTRNPLIVTPAKQRANLRKLFKMTLQRAQATRDRAGRLVSVARRTRRHLQVVPDLRAARAQRRRQAPPRRLRRNRATLTSRARIAAVLITALLPLLAAAPASAAVAPKGFLGVNTSWTLTPESFEEMASAHVGMLRTGWIFDGVKQNPGTPYDWSGLDAFVGGSARNGIDAIPVMYGVPSWISTERGATPLGQAEGEWEKYLTAAVERYGPKGDFWPLHPDIPYRPIRVWQVWNEPNSRTWWRPRPNPKEYGRLLAASAKAIHAADRRAKVMTAGIVAQPTNAAAIPGNAYLRGLFKSKAARKATDIVAFHPYAPTSRDVEKQLKSARKTLKKSRMGRTPIWVTEIGWGSVGPENHPLIMPEPKLEKEFAKVLRMAVDRRRKLNLGSFLWYQWQDHPDDICLWCESSGLIDYSGAAKPLLGIFESIARL